MLSYNIFVAAGFSPCFLQVTYRCGQLIWVVDRHLSWIPFMNFARCPEEQNVEVFLSDGSFFFRTIDRVARGEELLIWPTEGLCRSLRIPNLVTPRVNERKNSFLILRIPFEYKSFCFVQSIMSLNQSAFSQLIRAHELSLCNLCF